MKVLALNKDARRNFQLSDFIQAGIALEGWEVKSIRAGHTQLQGSFIRIRKEEAYWVNGYISKYKNGQGEMDERRDRKLLLKKSEIKQLIQKQDAEGRHAVPTAIGLRGPHIKLEIGIGRSKRKQDRRSSLRSRDDTRRAEQEMKNRMR